MSYIPLVLASPFLDGRVELMVDDSASPRRFAIQVLPQHCNGQGLAHGGFLSTLVDVAAAYSLAPMLPASATFVTTSLRAEFVGAAKAGDMLQSKVDRLKLGARSAVVTGAWLCGDAEVVVFAASFVLRTIAPCGPT